MKIVIADDHSLILSGFLNLLKAALPQSQVLTADNKAALFELLESEAIEILFQDIKFGRYDAREFVKTIKEKYPRLKIIIISTLNDEHSVNTLLKQGIDGYISKSDDSSEILAAIRSVQGGQRYISTDVQRNMAANHIEKSNITLTNREEEVLRAIIDGKTIKEAAGQLFLSEKTIESYRANLFLKFDVSNVAGLVKKAILEGYL